MKKYFFTVAVLCVMTAFAQSKLPPLQKSIEDPATGLNLQPGFAAEIIYKVDKKKYGSWISMAFDSNGRLTVSDQGKAGTFRLEIPKVGEKFDESKITKLDLPSSNYGMLYAFDHLYMFGMAALSRARVLDNGELGKPETILKAQGGGEHGPHSIIVSKDGKNLYIIAGNYTKAPEFQKSRIQTNWADDNLLINYAYGHNANGKAPAGWVMKVSPDGKERELINMGYRNPVDFCLNRHGEMFVYDADMEWDIGAPWYRPTRINHGVSGAENGWRATSKKWRKYFPDTVGSVIDIGPGCPTGVIAGKDAKFPTHFRDSIFICDWTFATMYSIHLKPQGSSYTAEKREFISNTKGPLSLTDVVIGPDGHMYFCAGGRNQQSYLYRVYYKGNESTALSKLDQTGAEARKKRHMIESFHGHPDPKAVDTVWSYLGSDDYHLRYAARIAIEWQDYKTWAEKAINEKNDLAAIHALLGLARRDAKEHQAAIINRLNSVKFEALDKMGKLALLRTYAVTFSRLGKPDESTAQTVGNKLDKFFPAKDENLNEELCRVLSYLEHPNIISKTLNLMKITKAKVPDYDAEIMKRNKGYGGKILKSMESAPNIMNIHYLFCLKDVKKGWQMEQRKVYLAELKELMTKSGGNMFTGYIQKIRQSAIESVPEKEKVALQYLMGEVKTIDLAKLPKAKGPGVAWTVESALKELGTAPLNGRSLANGRKMFAAGMCVACHRFGREGGGVGPDLTNLAKRSDYKSILESILQPNLVVSEQFEQHEIKLKDGTAILGRIVTEEGGIVSIVQSGFTPEKLTKVKSADIVSRKASKISMMPPALINSMNAEELKDLIAYFISQGDKRHSVYKKSKKKYRNLKIKLISAVYGAQNDSKKQIDVKKIIQKKLDSRDFDFTMTNQLAGKDPAPGVVKTLVIKYEINGKAFTREVKENTSVPWK